MTSVSYTIKEINSVHFYTTYTVIGICHPTQGQQTLTQALSSAFKCLMYFILLTKILHKVHNLVTCMHQVKFY